MRFGGMAGRIYGIGATLFEFDLFFAIFKIFVFLSRSISYRVALPPGVPCIVLLLPESPALSDSSLKVDVSFKYRNR